VVVDVVAFQMMKKRKWQKKLRWFLANIATRFFLNQRRFVLTVVREGQRKFKCGKQFRILERFSNE